MNSKPVYIDLGSIFDRQILSLVLIFSKIALENTMVMLQAVVSFLLLATMATATKDANYYPGGTSNPNVNNPMYWNDAVNVLQDLKQFQALYIKFHSCVYVYVIN